MLGRLISKLAGKTPGPPPGETPDFPWSDDDNNILCNFAYGDFVHNLQRLLTTDDNRLHCETLLAASGAVAGFAAQRALFTQAKASGENISLHAADTKDGRRFYFSEALNQMLVANTRDVATARLWPMAAGATLAAGVAERRLPTFAQMFGHVSRAIGAADPFMPSVAPNNHPHQSIEDLLRLAWPLARACFNGEVSARAMGTGEVVKPKWRPIVAAWAANTHLNWTHQALAPRTGLIILMESAIYASKLDPATFDPPA